MAPRQFRPSRSFPPANERRENKLFVGNLDPRLTEYTVIKLFEPFGPIAHFDYLWYDQGPRRCQPRGQCFVEYKNHEDAEKAVLEMNGKDVHGRALNVHFVSANTVDSNVTVTHRRQERSKHQHFSRKKPSEEIAAQETALKLSNIIVPSNFSTARKIALVEEKLNRIRSPSAAPLAGPALMSPSFAGPKRLLPPPRPKSSVQNTSKAEKLN